MQTHTYSNRYKLLTGLQQQQRRRRRSCTNPQIYTRGNAEFSVSSRLKEVRPKTVSEDELSWKVTEVSLWGFFIFLSLMRQNLKSKFISSVRLVRVSLTYLTSCRSDLLHTVVWFCPCFWMFFGLEEKQQVPQSHRLVLVEEHGVPARRNSSSSQTNLGMQLQAWICSFTTSTTSTTFPLSYYTWWHIWVWVWVWGTTHTSMQECVNDSDRLFKVTLSLTCFMQSHLCQPGSLLWCSSQ